MCEVADTGIGNLDRVFNPRSVAVVGDKRALGFMWLRSLSSFRGNVWSVQIDPNELPGIRELGVTNHLSLLDIPEPVDYVIAAVPRNVAPKIVEDCIQKRVGGVCFFTSGFAETQTEEGQRLQRQIVDMARQSGLNVIGPNCVGVYNPKIGLRHSEAQQYGGGGPVGFIAQSGTHATLFSILAPRSGVRISKSVSYGNAAVLDSTDFLEYLGADSETEIIGLYVEGVRDGRRFFRVARDVGRRKPLVIWKGGETEAGARATASHTGALAQSADVWDALADQCGAIKVNDLDGMIDVMRMLLRPKPVKEGRVGLIGMSGGQAVVLTDTFAKAGLDVPLLTEESYGRLAEFFDIIGGSYRNPLDVSSTFLLAADGAASLMKMLEILEQDRHVDSIVLELFPVIRPFEGGENAADPLLDAIAEFDRRSSKPFMVVVTAGHDEVLAVHARGRLQDRGVLTFPRFERAAYALRRLVDYWRYREGINPN